MRELAATLRAGGVLAIPTESSYGLAVDPGSARGVERVLQIKGRDAAKALLVLVADRAQLEGLGVAAPKATLDRFETLWPAPLTVVLPLAAPLPASCGAPTLAVRIPAHPRLRALVAQTGPLTATSLNRSGQSPCVDPDEAARLFEGEVDVLVDGGATPGGLPSTLLDATVDPPRVLRAGAFPWPPAAR
ncbi:MAG TPA: L-threonylcarbamoyladenylate synthase [Thermoanaerobaculia bacterium]|nr:L-threonylcarbamoyladenylate synthase [Thermoanaerobaculia bacterium]